MYDRYFEATAEQSFGRLSFAPLVADAAPPHRLRARGDAFEFHHQQSVAYLEQERGIATDGSEFFVIHVHAPLLQGRSPMARCRCVIDFVLVDPKELDVIHVHAPLLQGRLSMMRCCSATKFALVHLKEFCSTHCNFHTCLVSLKL